MQTERDTHPETDTLIQEGTLSHRCLRSIATYSNKYGCKSSLDLYLILYHHLADIPDDSRAELSDGKNKQPTHHDGL